MPDDINIVFFFDQNFEQAALVAAYSISKSIDPRRNVTIHAFHLGDLGFEAKTRPLQSERFRIVGRQIDNPFHPDDGIAYDNPAYYLRLTVAELLPHLDKVLYLDVDLLVLQDLSTLYDTDLGGRAIGAVADGTVDVLLREAPVGRTVNTTTIVTRRYIESFLQPGARYFNSGVMLIDLAAWRRHGYRDTALAFVRDRYMVLFADQDALNAVIGGDMTLLPGRWNYMATLDPASSNEPPAIAHYAAYKPWRCTDRWTEADAAYWDYVMKTPFGAKVRDDFFWSLAYSLADLDARTAKVPRDYWGSWRFPFARFRSRRRMAAKFRQSEAGRKAPR